jgi:hypothetical protein
MFLYLRDTNLYTDQPTLTDDTTQPTIQQSSDPNRDERLNQWRRDRRSKFSKHEKHLEEMRAQERTRLRREEERRESLLAFQRRRKERFDVNPTVDDLRKQTHERDLQRKSKHRERIADARYARYQKRIRRNNEQEANKKSEMDPTVNQLIADDSQQMNGPDDGGQAGQADGDAGADGGAGADVGGDVDVGGDGGGGGA